MSFVPGLKIAAGGGPPPPLGGAGGLAGRGIVRTSGRRQPRGLGSEPLNPHRNGWSQGSGTFPAAWLSGVAGLAGSCGMRPGNERAPALYVASGKGAS